MKLDRFQKLAVSTTLATYFLIAVGGIVRASGAGLGCPDWPRCFGLWIPPLEASQVLPPWDPTEFNVVKTWTEYVNRLIGVVVGFLILATTVAAVVRHRRSRHVLWPTVASFVLVLFQGWLGGQVVASALAPLVLTLHLVLALVIVGLLLYATVSAFFPRGRPKVEPRRRGVARASFAVILLVLAQTGLGAMVRGRVQLAEKAGLPREEWLRAVSGIDAVHEVSAVFVAAAVVFVAYALSRLRVRDRWLRRASTFSVVMLVTQIAAGIGLARFDMPAVLQVVHLWCGSLLIGGLMVQTLLLNRLDPRGTADQLPRAEIPA